LAVIALPVTLTLPTGTLTVTSSTNWGVLKFSQIFVTACTSATGDLLAVCNSKMSTIIDSGLTNGLVSDNTYSLMGRECANSIFNALSWKQLSASGAVPACDNQYSVSVTDTVNGCTTALKGTATARQTQAATFQARQHTAIGSTCMYDANGVYQPIVSPVQLCNPGDACTFAEKFLHAKLLNAIATRTVPWSTSPTLKAAP